MSSESASHDLFIQMQDGSRLDLRRDAEDRLVVTGHGALNGQAEDVVLDGLGVIGFGPWPGWQTNLANRVATLPDEESGLFEPERLFVLREQYVFLAPVQGGAVRPVSLGPIHKAWWGGTEHVVQARQVSSRH